MMAGMQGFRRALTRSAVCAPIVGIVAYHLIWWGYGLSHASAIDCCALSKGWEYTLSRYLAVLTALWTLPVWLIPLERLGAAGRALVRPLAVVLLMWSLSLYLGAFGGAVHSSKELNYFFTEYQFLEYDIAVTAWIAGLTVVLSVIEMIALHFFQTRRRSS